MSRRLARPLLLTLLLFRLSKVTFIANGTPGNPKFSIVAAITSATVLRDSADYREIKFCVLKLMVKNYPLSLRLSS